MMPEIHFLNPHAVALALPAAAAWWWWCREGHGRWLRLVVLTLIIIAATRPELAWGRGGSDVVLVLDRSASMGEARARQDELIRLIGDQRREGDRLAVVAVGDGAVVAQAPQHTGLPHLPEVAIGDGASDLAAGLEQAGALIAPGRNARIIIHSDGEFTGLEPRRATARLALSALPVDVLPERRPPLPDAAVLDIELPQELRLGESFLGAARLISDHDQTRHYRVLREAHRGDGDRLVAEGDASLAAARPLTITFPDRPPRAGLATYRVELDASDDRQPLNNRAVASLRVTGGERVLVMGGDGTPGNLARALQSAGMAVSCRGEGPLTLDDLLGVSVLVLEQVPADRLGINGLEAVARWVEHLGGGLVMTGGRRGFGCGGYHKSAVERVLPVTMELRDEHRKLAVAMAIAMDRSGSMGVTTPSGRPKMDLADEGAVAAIELLGPHDLVAVHAVDTEPHVIIPLSPVTDPAGMARRVMGVHSEGGGIYVYQALLGAGKELLGASTGTRHLVLFADAADAEEPGDYAKLLDDYAKAGITVSVVAMGNVHDKDAEFLEDVARRGNGRIAFAEAPEDIPRLFAQETVLVARSSWIDDAVGLQAKAEIGIELGRDPLFDQPWPTVHGYNLTYLREHAQVLALAPGDPQAPALASWRIGGGRAVAVCLNVDDPKSPELLAWPGYGPLLADLVRWSAGGGSTAPGALSATRAGRRVTLRLELDPGQRARWPMAAPQLVLDRDGEIGEAKQVSMDQVDDGRYEAVVRIDDEHALVPAVTVDHQAILGPALRLPYSPEAEPRFGRAPGDEILAAIARDTGGRVRSDTLDAFKNPPSAGELAGIAAPLLIAALILALLEILVRRLRIAWPARRQARASATIPAATAQDNPSAQPTPAANTAATTGGDPPAAPAIDPGLHEALRQLRKRR